MARHIDPVCKLCRREGIKLYLKGTRCESPKCAIERRNQPPGMHVRRGKPSEYGIRLREKQKLKRFYGVFERQFRRYFELASRSTENTGEQLLSIMERRLDNIIPRPRVLNLINQQVQDAGGPPVPDYLERAGGDAPEGRVLRLPSRGDVDPRIA